MTQQTTVPPHASETTRLLCAGTYLDEGYRHAVIDELYVHEERIVAPSFGFDAARVLAHALRAHRMEFGWSTVILLLWILSVPLTDRLSLMFLPPVVLMSLARWVSGSRHRPVWYRRCSAWVMRVYAWFSVAYALMSLYGIGTRDLELVDRTHSFWEWLVLPRLVADHHLYEAAPSQAWMALALPPLVALAAGVQRQRISRVLADELSPQWFPDAMADSAELTTETSRFDRLRHRIRLEQHAPLVMYRADRPFCGAGEPHSAWSLSVELRPLKEHEDDPDPVPLDNRTVLNRIMHLLTELSRPSTAPTPDSAAVARDRLRDLEIKECVFLPVAGLPSREHAPYNAVQFEQHRSHAVEESGEARRHFLRVQIDGWNGQLVTTVFVRVHTQGRMLMLEVAPHLLRPVRPLFRDADRLAHDYLHAGLFGKAVWALARVPHSTARSVATLWRALTLLGRLVAGGHGRALPDGPTVSVRELGSDDEVSHFQQMDHDRYLKTVQNRVANGVCEALRAAGWRTAEFERQIADVSNGGVLIESARGAVVRVGHSVVGDQAPPSRRERTPEPEVRVEGGAVHIGSAQPFTVVTHTMVSQQVEQSVRDGEQEQLLRSVRQLREDLRRVVTTPETEELDTQLAAIESEIQSTGRASAERLPRLRTALEDAAPVVGPLASGAAVGQAVATLLGG